MAIQLLSNVKIITSGQMPTPDNLQPGEAAFGKLTSDGKYHLFGNSDGEVVDIKYQVSVGVFSEEQVFCFSAMIIYY